MQGERRGWKTIPISSILEYPSNFQEEDHMKYDLIASGNL